MLIFTNLDKISKVLDPPKHDRYGGCVRGVPGALGHPTDAGRFGALDLIDMLAHKGETI